MPIYQRLRLAQKTQGGLFMDEEQGVNEQVVAEPVEQEQSQPVESVETQEVAEPVQDGETNAKFAQYRRESEQARQERDQAIAKLDSTIAEHYGDSHGIKTWDAYQQAKQQAEQQQRAEQLNMDPKLYQEYEGLKQERDGLRHEKTLSEQDKSLSADPDIGPIYKKYKDDVQSLAKQANCDYEIALTLLLRNKLPELLNTTKSTAEQDAVKKLISNGQSSPGALGQGGSGNTSTISSMSKADFKTMQEQVLRGERRQI